MRLAGRMRPAFTGKMRERSADSPVLLSSGTTVPAIAIAIEKLVEYPHEQSLRLTTRILHSEHFY